MNLDCLPDEIIFNIMKIVYHSLHSEYVNKLNDEFKKYILEESDIGSIILCRIEGMPLLIDV